MRRTVKEQIKSGAHVGLGAGSLLIAGMLLSMGMRRVVWSTAAPRHVVWSEPIGWAELLAGAIILLLTADVWWRFLAGIMFLGCLKGVVIFVTGRNLYAPHDPLPRLESAGLTVFAAVAVAMLIRFADARPTIVDRVALTLSVFCFTWSITGATFSVADLSLVAGLIVLLISWAVSWLRRDDKG